MTFRREAVVERLAKLRRVLRNLGEHGVISSELRERLRGLGGFRNVLVHGYLDIDPERVLELLTTRLDDLSACADAMEEFLASLDDPPASGSR